MAGTKPVKVVVEYCTGWGYKNRFDDLKKQILAKIPNATVIGNVGRKSSFEVEINGVLVFSKLAKNAFPDFAEVVARALDASQGKAVQPVNGVEK